MNLSQRKKGTTPLMYIVLFLVFLASMNVISRYYVFMFVALGLFFLKPRRKLYLDMVSISLLFVLGISWVLFSPNSTISIFGVVKPFTYLLCYIMGCAMIRDDTGYSSDNTPYNLFYKTVLAVALGTFAHYIANWISNAGATNRNTVDIWTGEVMAATGQASLACIPLALAIACIFCKNNTFIKIASIVTVVLVLMYNLVLSGRTLLLMFLAIIAIALGHRLIMQKKGSLKVLVIFVVIVLLLLTLYQANAFGIKSYVEDSPLFDRFFAEDSSVDIEEDVRMDRKFYYLENFAEHLLGGVHFRKDVGYAHDIYLDTYDEAGIFAFIAISAYMLISVFHLIQCIKDKSLPFAYRQIVLCTYVAIYIEFMIEPILQGMPWLFAAFCLIDGYVAGILRHNKMIQNREIQEKV